MADQCPHPCQLLILLLQLPFQLPQMFLNVAMTFLGLGAGTVSHLGDLCSFCSGPICHIPWYHVVLGMRVSRSETQLSPIILEQNCYYLFPSASCPGLTLKLTPIEPSQGLKGIIHGKR